MSKKLINPSITQDCVTLLSEKATYIVNVIFEKKPLPIYIFPTVFPPVAKHKSSLKTIIKTFGNITNKEIIDIGGGCGLMSISLALAGAKHIDVTDINPNAVKCIEYNIKINELGHKINVFESDLFSNVPSKKYDIIIGYLPIVNYKVKKSNINNTFYDDGYKIRKRFLKDARKFLNIDGTIVMLQGNLQSIDTDSPDGDFSTLELMIKDYDYTISSKTKISKGEDPRFDWFNYKLKDNRK